MAINRLKNNMSIISELSDEPNDVDGLSSTELKAKFDTAGTIIKEFINNSLIPEVEAEIVQTVSDTSVQSGNMPAGGEAGQALIKASDAHFDWGFRSINEVPPGGWPGYVLTKESSEDFDVQFKPKTAFDWVLEQQYEEAGTYIWTAPDVYSDGLPYSAGVRIVGGGGSGGSAANVSNELIEASATGGASGYAKNIIVEVTPGEEYPIVVGKGGARLSTGTSSKGYRREGNAGGSSAFDGVTALGGGGGWGALHEIASSGKLVGVAAQAANGGQGSDAIDPAYLPNHRSMPAIAPAKGLATYCSAGDYGLVGGRSDMSSLYNRFDRAFYLAAGGMAVAYGYSSAGWYAYAQQGYTFENGLKSGGGAAHSLSNAGAQLVAQDAKSPGCGGGGAATRAGAGSVSATSGAGADGAVYIYVRRQQR